MFYLPFDYKSNLQEYLEIPIRNNFTEIADMHKALSPYLEFLEISPPHVAVFYHSMWHGNVTNKEIDSRWSINIRFKNLFSPYRGKKMGDFFMLANLSPFTSKALSIDGLSYE